MFTKAFWRDAIERAVSTAAQAVLTLLSLDGTNVVKVDMDLGVVLATAGFGALFAILKALAATQIGDKSSASLLPEATTYER